MLCAGLWATDSGHEGVCCLWAAAPGVVAMGAGQGFQPQGGGRGEQGGWLWGSGGTSAAGGFELMVERAS